MLDGPQVSLLLYARICVEAKCSMLVHVLIHGQDLEHVFEGLGNQMELFKTDSSMGSVKGHSL